MLFYSILFWHFLCFALCHLVFYCFSWSRDWNSFGWQDFSCYSIMTRCAAWCHQGVRQHNLILADNWRFFPSSCLFLLTQLRLFLVLVNGHVSQGRLVMGRREGDYQICCIFVDHVHTQNSTICNNVSIVLLAHGDDLYHLDYTASCACNFSCSPHVLITSISIFCRKIHVLI